MRVLLTPEMRYAVPLRRSLIFEKLPVNVKPHVASRDRGFNGLGLYCHQVVNLSGAKFLRIFASDVPCAGDECFWNFPGDRSRVTALATSDEIVGDKVSAEPFIWAYERGKGRVVASTLGHFD